MLVAKWTSVRKAVLSNHIRHRGSISGAEDFSEANGLKREIVVRRSRTYTRTGASRGYPSFAESSYNSLAVL